MYAKNATNILLIEDNQGDVALIKKILQNSSLKHTLWLAETLFEAINLIGNQGIQIILLDLSLPDSIGFKTLTTLLETAKHLPIIVLTGTNNDIIGDQAVRAGAQDYLVKGQFDDKLLLKSIKYALQRHKTQVKLEELATEFSNSEKRFIEAQQMAKFGSWEMDIVSNKMRWSDEMYKIFGFQPNSFDPKLSDYLGYTHLDDRDDVAQFFDTIVQQNSVQQIEHRILTKGQTTIKYLALQSKIYFDEHSDRLLLLGVVQDITERKQNELLVLEKNINQKSSRVKDEMLRDLSFYLRTPLSTIVNYVYLLEATGNSMTQKDYIEKIKTSSEDLSSVVNNLLNYTLINYNQLSIETEEFGLQELMLTVKKIIQLKASKNNLKLDFTFEKLEEKCVADAKKLTQIIFNLLDSNIQQLNKQMSSLHIRVELRKLDRQHGNLSLQFHNPSLVLSPARIAELLDAHKLLETLNEQENPFIKLNFGLGVAIKLVELMKGSFTIYSTEKTGTTYGMEIPVEVIADTKAKAAPAQLEQSLKILLVDDHFLNQIATKKLLLNWSENSTVDIAENGLVAYDKFREHGYDLILMDLQMPVMNGFDATIKIRQLSEVPIIALTASSSKQEERKCYDVGMSDYLAKPFKPEELFEKIMHNVALSRAKAIKI